MGYDKKQRNEKSKKNAVIGLIAVLAVTLVIGFVIICVTLAGVLKESGEDKESATRYETQANKDMFTDETSTSVTEGLLYNDTYSNTVVTDASEYITFYQSTVEENNREAETTTTVKTTKSEAVSYYEQLSKNGDNLLSDDSANEFIKLIAEQYNVDTDLLVAIYSVPDTGNNFVLQFKDSRASTGKVVKNPDTLEKVYQIDKSRNVKIATGTIHGNVGVSYGEGMLAFYLVKTVVMEQYPEYFTDIKR